MNRTEMEKVVEAKFAALNEFLNGDFVAMHEYPVDDPEFKRLAFRLFRLAIELKLSIDELSEI